MNSLTGTTVTSLAGTLRLMRLAVRRDRVLLPVWIVAISGVMWMTVASYVGTMADPAERAATAAFAAGNPMSRVFDGAASGPELGAMIVVDAYKVLAILTALMSAQAIIRHTRQDEEAGRAELLGSAVVGRYARLTAALVVTLGANLVLGAAVAGVLASSNLDLPGSLAAGLAVGGIGWVFAGIAAVTSQVFATARGANSAVGGALGVAFLLRAIGDLLGTTADNGVAVVSAWPSWLSPMGWGHQVRPFYQDNWWIAGLFVGFTIVLITMAFALASHRDIGSGMVPARSGPAYAPQGLLSTIGLAWRLQRGILLAWAIGLTVTGAAFGSIGKSAEELVGENDQMRQMLDQLSPGADVSDLYFTFLMAFIGIAAAGYGVQALLRMRAEEVAGRLEPVLGASVSRSRWLAGHMIIAAGGTTAILTLSGLASGLVYGAMTGEWSDGPGSLVCAALVQVPAALALGGFGVAAFGLMPRLAGSLTWAALAAALVMGQLGALLKLPQWLLNISPFTHVPLVPAEALSITPLVWLLVATAALGGLGMLAFQRRDLAIGA